MTDAEVREFIDTRHEGMATAFGLGHWRIQIEYTRFEPDESGFLPAMQCHSKFEYERAVIKIDPAAYSDADGPRRLKDDLEHELLHIMHAPFNILYDLAQSALSKEAFDLWYIGWHRAQEMTLCNLERLVHRLRPEPNEN